MSKKKDRKVEMPPVLSAEDDKILDRIWDEIGREEEDEKDKRETDS